MKLEACVYLMWCDSKDVFKIGFSTQMPEKRKAQIETQQGNPWNESINIEVISTILFDDTDAAMFFEKYLHETCSDYLRAGNEWFEPLPTIVELLFENEVRGIWGWREIAMFMKDNQYQDALDCDVIRANERYTIGEFISSLSSGDMDEIQWHIWLAKSTFNLHPKEIAS